MAYKEEDITPSNTIIIATGDNSNVGKILGKNACLHQKSSMNTTVNDNMIKFDSDRCIDGSSDKTSTLGSSLSTYNGQTSKTTTDATSTDNGLNSHKINSNTTGTISKIYNERDNNQVEGSGNLLLFDMESIDPQASGSGDLSLFDMESIDPQTSESGDFFLSDDEDLDYTLMNINESNAKSGIFFDPLSSTITNQSNESIALDSMFSANETRHSSFMALEGETDGHSLFYVLLATGIGMGLFFGFGLISAVLKHFPSHSNREPERGNYSAV